MAFNHATDVQFFKTLCIKPGQQHVINKEQINFTVFKISNFLFTIGFTAKIMQY